MVPSSPLIVAVYFMTLGRKGNRSETCMCEPLRGIMVNNKKPIDRRHLYLPGTVQTVKPRFGGSVRFGSVRLQIV